jgi:DNA-binding NtrC family response regulator
MAYMPEQMRIAVVIEDDRDERDLIGVLLEETGLRVVEIDGTDEAFQFLGREADQVSLVFSDVPPPYLMSSVDIARTICDAWPWISVLVLIPDGEDRTAVLPDAATYISKPWRGLDVLVAANRAATRFDARVGR